MLKVVFLFLKRFIATAHPNTLHVLRRKYVENEQGLIYDLIFTAYSAITELTEIHCEQNIYRLNLKLRIQARKTNFIFFIIDMCPDVKLNWHHIEWNEMAQDYNSISVILASRGLGKTFYWAELWPTWLMYRYTPNSIVKEYRFNSVQIFSMTQDKANEKLGDIIKRINNTPALRDVFPSFKTEKASKIVTNEGFTIKAFGFNTGSRGGHVYYIICDDILKDNAIYSGDYRDKTHNNLTANVLPQLNDGGKMVIIGTPMHSNDTYGRLKSISKKGSDINVVDSINYIVREYPAILPDGRLCWAFQRSERYLNSQRLAQGELIFAQEYLCRPVSEGSSIFPYRNLNKSKNRTYSYVNSIEDFPYINDILFTVSGTDFAISGATGADYFCNCVLAVTTWKQMFVVYIRREKGMDYNDQIGELRNSEINFSPTIMAVENNNFQKIYENNYKEEYKFSSIKGYTTTTNKNNYIMGLPAVSVLFERRILQFPYKDDNDVKMTSKALEEFNSIAFTDKGLKSTGGHDDIPFAIWKAYQAALDVMETMGFNIVSM